MLIVLGNQSKLTSLYEIIKLARDTSDCRARTEGNPQNGAAKKCAVRGSFSFPRLNVTKKAIPKKRLRSSLGPSATRYRPIAPRSAAGKIAKITTLNTTANTTNEATLDKSH